MHDVYNCEGVRPRHMSMAVSMAEAELFKNALPVRPKQFLILDAPMLVRGFVKLMKPFLTQKMQSRIKFIRSDDLELEVSGGADERVLRLERGRRALYGRSAWFGRRWPGRR